MANRCDLTGVGIQTGNKVSHSNRKSRRRFIPNIQNVTLYSEKLARKVRLKVAVSTLRSVDHNGGIDGYILSTASAKLSTIGKKLKAELKEVTAGDTSENPVAKKPAAKKTAKKKDAAA